jgi:hypothetical protein
MKPSLQLAKPIASVRNADRRQCLVGVSADAHVDYFRCQKCGHVWNLPRAVSEPPCDYPEADRRS